MLAQLFALVEELLGGKASAIPLRGARDDALRGVPTVPTVSAGADGILGAAGASTSRERAHSSHSWLERIGIGKEPVAFTPPSSASTLDPQAAAAFRAESAGFPQPRLIEALTAGAAVHIGAVHTGTGRSQQAAVAVGVHSKLGGDADLLSRTQAALCALRLLYVHLLGLRRASLDIGALTDLGLISDGSLTDLGLSRDIGALTDLGLQTQPSEPPLFFRVC